MYSGDQPKKIQGRNLTRVQTASRLYPTLNSYCNFIGLAYTTRRSAKVECGCGGAAAVRRPHPTPHSRRHTTIHKQKSLNTTHIDIYSSSKCYVSLYRAPHTRRAVSLRPGKSVSAASAPIHVWTGRRGRFGSHAARGVCLQASHRTAKHVRLARTNMLAARRSA